jgi:hypothetical protein
LHAVGEYVVEFQIAFQGKEVVARMCAAFGADSESKHGVLESPQLLLVEHTAAPVVILPERLVADMAADGVFVPAVANLAEQLHKACLAQPTDQFSADKLVRNIRDYANAIAQREHKEEELMDSKLIEDEIKSLERNYD